MTDEELGRELFRLARHFPCVNHQETALIREAARRLTAAGKEEKAHEEKNGGWDLQ